MLRLVLITAVFSLAVSSNTTSSQSPSIYQVDLVALFVATSELPVYHEVIKPALHLAAIEAMRRFPQFNITVEVRQGSDTCLTNYAGAYAAEAYYSRSVSESPLIYLFNVAKFQVSAFIGPACSFALDSVARMASYWNVPVITAGGLAAEFANKNLYSSLTRLSFSIGKNNYTTKLQVCQWLD